jgi:hypothetical protein
MADRALLNGDRGYFCISEPGKSPILQGEIDGERREVWVGCDQAVAIEKMFGPLIFASIRVRADFQSGEWIIERDGHDGWGEFARVPGQTAEDFPDD